MPKDTGDVCLYKDTMYRFPSRARKFLSRLWIERSASPYDWRASCLCCFQNITHSPHKITTFSWYLQIYHYFHPSISFVNYALFTHNTRTIDAQYTHYSNTFLSGSVAFESYSSIYCLSTTCLVLGDFPPSKFSSTTLDGVLSRVSRLPNLLTLNSSECNESPLNRSFAARLYTLHPILYTKKSHKNAIFLAHLEKKVYLCAQIRLIHIVWTYLHS